MCMVYEKNVKYTSRGLRPELFSITMPNELKKWGRSSQVLLSGVELRACITHFFRNQKYIFLIYYLCICLTLHIGYLFQNTKDTRLATLYIVKSLFCIFKTHFLTQKISQKRKICNCYYFVKRHP